MLHSAEPAYRQSRKASGQHDYRDYRGRRGDQTAGAHADRPW
jgi:hypothetical protein